MIRSKLTNFIQYWMVMLFSSKNEEILFRIMLQNEWKGDEEFKYTDERSRFRSAWKPNHFIEVK